IRPPQDPSLGLSQHLPSRLGRPEVEPLGCVEGDSGARQASLADAEAAEVALIVQAARGGSWQAAAWLLEHRFAERWGRTRPPAEAERTRALRLSPDERDREIERLLEEEIARRAPESAFEDEH
ncbi:MAG: hypothetical protein LC790_15520, partial [Actinobacteria bacterium]|nr:hypothetical protein [Actinomycetota bacterium]